MLTKFLKIFYIQSLIADNALLQISTRIGKDVIKPFTTFKEMLKILTAKVGNPNEKKEAGAAYRFLC